MILLTGATGFLGRHLVDEFLAQGHELRLLVRNASDRTLPWGNLVEVVSGDILDPLILAQAMEGVETVVHAAAVVSFARKKRNTLKQANVTGTARVVDACLATGVNKLLHISSISATGRAGKGEWVDESTKWQDNASHDLYGQTKRAAELEIHRGIAEGLHAVMLNPGVILGPGDWTTGPPKIFQTIHKGLAFYNGAITGFVGVKDVAKAALMVLEKPISAGERFILVSENLAQKEMLSMIAHAIGAAPPRYKLPPALAPIVGIIAETWSELRGKEALITRGLMRAANNVTYFNGEKATKDLGLSYTPIQKVIEETAAVFLEEMMK